MKNKKVLWLVSWYPNRIDPFDGDFIQRHAQAAAKNQEVHVLFVKGDETIEDVQTDITQEGQLTEQRIYFHSGRNWLDKIVKHIRWRRLFINAVKAYELHNGPPDIVHVHIPWKAGIIALYLKKKFGWSFIVSEHWGIYNRVAEGNIFQQPAFVKRGIQRVIQNANALTSVSTFLGSGIHEFISKKPFTVLPNVVDTALFYPSEERSPRFRFLHVSNMVPLKNVGGILEAFALFQQEVSDSELVMIGNRDDVWPAFAAANKLTTGVSFLGEISYGEVAAFMRASHCFILNSHIENAPCVVSEALCSGLPVIATAVGGVPEMVNEKNGLLIPAQNTAQLHAAMREMYYNWQHFDREKVAADAKARYGTEAVAAQFTALYHVQTKTELR